MHHKDSIAWIMTYNGFVGSVNHYKETFDCNAVLGTPTIISNNHLVYKVMMMFGDMKHYVSIVRMYIYTPSDFDLDKPRAFMALEDIETVANMVGQAFDGKKKINPPMGSHVAGKGDYLSVPFEIPGKCSISDKSMLQSEGAVFYGCMTPKERHNILSINPRLHVLMSVELEHFIGVPDIQNGTDNMFALKLTPTMIYDVESNNYTESLGCGGFTINPFCLCRSQKYVQSEPIVIVLQLLDQINHNTERTTMMILMWMRPIVHTLYLSVGLSCPYRVVLLYLYQ